jgi:uncharacterized membrane protein
MSRPVQSVERTTEAGDEPVANDELNFDTNDTNVGMPNGNAKRLARGLGWFSVGLGLTELLAPGLIARISGVSSKRTGLIRLYGARELASGIAIFSQENPAQAVWSRVAGDGLDLASLAIAGTSPDAKRGRLAFATANVLAVTALDVICARQLTNGSQGVHAKASCVINSDPQEVYETFCNFENLPRFMKHLESVEDLGEGISRWTAKAPVGTEVTWRARIVADVPGEVISWRSLEGSDVDNAGAVRFEEAPGGRGTIVRVNLKYVPLAGALGAAVAKLFGEEPEQQLHDDLRRFKQVLEIGDVVVSDATLFGTGYMEQRPGQPPAETELTEAELPGYEATGTDDITERSAIQQ